MEWISVRERLPERFRFVLCAYEYKGSRYVCEGSYRGDGSPRQVTWFESRGKPIDAFAWMPLPAPRPRGSDGEREEKGGFYLDTMTEAAPGERLVPRFDPESPCAFCGHPKGRHEQASGACSVTECSCRGWRENALLAERDTAVSALEEARKALRGLADRWVRHSGLCVRQDPATMALTVTEDSCQCSPESKAALRVLGMPPYEPAKGE